MKEFTENLNSNLKLYSIQDWKKALSSSLAFRYTTRGYDINPNILYRARLNYDSNKRPITFFTNSSQLWAPPIDLIKSNGRCNTKGQSTLYCSNSVTTTLFEVNPNTGDDVTFMDYDVIENIENLGVVGCGEIMMLGDSYYKIFGDHFTESSDESKKLDEILSNIFKTSHSNDYPIYNITNAVFQMFMDEPKVDLVPDYMKPAKFNGLIYPSIATEKLLGINIAMDPDAVSHLLKPRYAFKYRILNKYDEHKYEIVLTHKTNYIDKDGSLSWVENKRAVTEFITDSPI